MRKVIDGKVCNTETSQLIYTCDNGHNAHDPGYCKETLYRTPEGTYFLLKFERSVMKDLYFPWSFFLFDNRKAQTWLESHGAPTNEIEAEPRG